MPALAHSYRNIDASKAATIGTSRHHSESSDKEYMNLKVPPSSSKGDVGKDCVVMTTGLVRPTSDNYVNLGPTSPTIDKPVPLVKDSENSANSYVNFDPKSLTRSQSCDNKPPLPIKKGESSSDNYVNFKPVSRAGEKKSELHISNSYNFDPTSQDNSVQNSHTSDSQYANVDYSKNRVVRRYHSSPSSHKRSPTTSNDEELPHHHIVFHTFPSDESLNSKPASEQAMSVGEPSNDDSTDYAAHPVIGPSEATRTQQQSDPSETSEYENLTPVNQSTGADLEYELMTPVASEYGQAVTKQPQQPAVQIYEDFVPLKVNDKCAAQTDQDNCPNSTYSVLKFQTENSHLAKPTQDDSSPYSQLSHSQKVTRSTTNSNYSKLEPSASLDSPKTGFYDHLQNQDTPPVVLQQTPEIPQVPPRELKKRMQQQQQPKSSSLYPAYPELPPRNPSFQGVIHSPMLPPAGPRPSLPLKLPYHQSSSSLNYSEVTILPAEIGQTKFRQRVTAVTQAMPVHKPSDNYAIIDKDASLGLQKALKQQEQDRLA